MKTIITSSDRSALSFAELKRYSGLFKYLSLRDIFLKYKQTWIGFGWSIIKPAVNILIFGLLSFLVEREGDFAQRFLYVSAGIILWQLFASAVTEVSNSLSNNVNILSKVYFPKIVLPLSSLAVCLVDFAISLVIFLICFVCIQKEIHWQIVFLPLVLVHTLLLALAFGLFFATGSIKYRDVKFLLPFMLQLLFYASPVFVSSSFFMNLNIPSFFKVVYQFNPLVHILNEFKYCIYGQFEMFNANYFILSIAFTIVLLFITFNYFLKFEKSFVDYI